MNYVGIDIGCTKMYICAMVNGEYIEEKTATGFNVTKENLKNNIDKFIEKLPYKPDGVGIALPGLVVGDYMVKFSDLSSLNGITTDYFSEGRFKVRFINDVKSATVAEVANNKEKDTIAVIMAGTGLAIGVYSQGKILKGCNGFSGELGYCMINTENGAQTVDSVSGGNGILNIARCSAPELLEKLNNNDTKAIELIEKAGYYFGLILTNIMHLYNPDLIIVGGSTSTYKGYMENALETCKKYTLEDIYNSCVITTPKDSRRIVALGAIEYIKSGIEI